MNYNYLSEQTPCPTVFCGCSAMGNAYNPGTQINVSFKVYLLLILVLVIIFLSIKIVLMWFTFKDYYPLKQKSPILCILLVLSICCQLVLYPILYFTHYFTAIFLKEENRYVFRSFQSGLQFSVFLIYLVRSLRISYANDTHPTRSKSLPFKIFQKQFLLAILVSILGLIKAAVVVLHRKVDPDDVGNSIKQFALTVQLQTPMLNQTHLKQQLFYIIRYNCFNFMWICILAYCMWLHRKINERYSMKYQIMLVIVSTIIGFALNVALLAYGVFRDIQNGPKPILNQYCSLQDTYPTTQLIKIVNLLLFLWISIIKPLQQKKVYHILLPTGRHYGFIKTMRDFLMQQQFLRVFTGYLKYLDNKNKTTTNLTLLQFWKKMILIKLNRKQSELDKLQSLKKLIESVQNILFLDQSHIIINLKDSILGLQQSITNSDKISHKYRQSINDKVDEIQKIAIERLDKIYTRYYSHTQSYYHLKKLTDQNKKVNLNMIMLNLALIVDSQNQFT